MTSNSSAEKPLLICILITLCAFFSGYLDGTLSFPDHNFFPFIALNYGFSIAIACAMGKRYMPCVFIGTFLIYHLKSPNTADALYLNALYASYITFGGILSSLALHRLVPDLKGFHTQRTILSFFILGALILGCASSILLTTLLAYKNIIPSSEIYYYGIMLSLSNLLGIILIVPMVILWKSSCSITTKRRQYFCTANSIILLCITTGVFLFTSTTHKEHNEKQLNQSIYALKKLMDNTVNELNMVGKMTGVFLRKKTDITPQTFHDFNSTFYTIHPEVISVSWSPLLTQEHISNIHTSSPHITQSLAHINDIESTYDRLNLPFITPFSLFSCNKRERSTTHNFLFDNAQLFHQFYEHIKKDDYSIMHTPSACNQKQHTLNFLVPYNKTSQPQTLITHNTVDGIIAITLNLHNYFERTFSHINIHNTSIRVLTSHGPNTDELIYSQQNEEKQNVSNHIKQKPIQKHLDFGQQRFTFQFIQKILPFSFYETNNTSFLFLVSAIFFIVATQLFCLINSANADELIDLAVQSAHDIGRQKTELELILNNMDTRIWIKDDANNIVLLNQKAAEARGGTIEDFEGKNCYDLFPRSAKKFHDDDLSVINSKKAVRNLIEHYTTKEGKKGWVEVSKIPYKNTYTGQNLLFVSARDITDQKKEQDLLRKIYIISQNDMLGSNRKILSILENTVRTLEVDLGIISYLEQDHYTIKHIYSLIDAPFQQGQTFDLAGDMMYSDATTNPNQENFVPFSDIEGIQYTLGMPLFTGNQFFGTMHFFNRSDSPVTPSSKLRSTIQLVAQFIGHELNLSCHIEELESLSYTLAKSNEELEDFARILAHDLKTPTRMLRQFMDLIQHDLSVKHYDNIDDYFMRAKRATTNMDSLVNALSEHTKLDGEVSFSYENCNNIIDAVLDHLTLVVEKSAAEIHIGLLPETIYGNRPLLIQLFENLISNGIKYCEEEKPIITIEALQNADFTTFSLADNGIGIPKEQHEAIFERFKRLHNTTKYLGTGLGLATCKQIVTRHNGEIWCEENPEGGSIFSFTLSNKPKNKTTTPTLNI